jgi:hypothetical protein
MTVDMVDTSRQIPVVRSESQADLELAEDQARQAGLSHVMDETSAAGAHAEQAQREHMVAELAVQREERDHERTEEAIAAAESEGMPPRPALPPSGPAASEPTQHRWEFVRHAGWMAAGLALLSLVVAGSAVLVRRRRHQQPSMRARDFLQRVKVQAQTYGVARH